MDYSIRTKSNAIKVEVNDRGDYIAIHPGNAKIFENFAVCRENILKLADDMPKRLEAIEKEYEGREDEKSADEKERRIFSEYVKFSETFIENIDGVFGPGTIRKYFADNYEEVHDFVPDEACAEDFFEQITPVIEQIFKKHLDKRKASMAKYKPQDHKKKGEK